MATVEAVRFEPFGAAHSADRRDLASPLQLLRRRKLVIAGVMLAVIALVLAYVLLVTPMYSATTTLQVAGYDTTAEDVGDPDPARPQDELRMANQLELLNSLPLARGVVRKLRLIDDPEFRSPSRSIRRKLGLLPARTETTGEDTEAAREASVIDDLMNHHVTIARVGVTHLITITVKTSDPRKSVMIANNFANLHIARLRDEKERATGLMIAQLDSRVNELRQQATSGERAAASYGRSRALIGTPGQAADPAAVDWLGNQLATARTSRVEAAARYSQFAASNGGAGPATTPLLNELLSQQSTLDKRLAELQAQFGPGYPDVFAAQAQRADVAARIGEERARIKRSLAADVSVAQAREQQLAGEVGSVRERAMNARDAGVGFGDLQSGAQTTRTQYLAQLARLQEVRGREARIQIEVSVAVKPVLPTSPSDPKVMRLLGVAVIAGLILGIIAAVAVEQMDDRVRTGDDVGRLLGVEALSMVPALTRAEAKLAPQQLIASQPTSVFSESIRTIYMALLGTLPTSGNRVVITSPLPGDGKTTIAVSLGAVAASLGIKTVIVDLDFRKPAVMSVMRRSPAPRDLIAYLDGEATLHEAISRDAATPRLDALSVARPPAEPGRYITAGMIAPLLATLGAQYQLVIVDAPPVLPISDARMLATLGDATLMVLGWGRTRDTAARAARQLMRGALTAAVVNRVDYRRHAAAAYGDELQHYSEYASYFGPAPILSRRERFAAMVARWFGRGRPETSLARG